MEFLSLCTARLNEHTKFCFNHDKAENISVPVEELQSAMWLMPKSELEYLYMRIYGLS